MMGAVMSGDTSNLKQRTMTPIGVPSAVLAPGIHTCSHPTSNALEIEMDKSTLYDEAFAKADEAFKRQNFCQIQRDEATGHMSCAHSRNPSNPERIAPPGTPMSPSGNDWHALGWDYSQHLCCGGCVHAGPTGCTVKALCCKLWTCRTLREQHPELRDELQVIRLDALRSGLPVYALRKSKEEAIGGAL